MEPIADKARQTCVVKNPLAIGLTAIGLLGAVACGATGGTGASPSSPRTARVALSASPVVQAIPGVPDAPAGHSAPTPAPTGCGTGPARRAWIEEISSAGRVTWQRRLPTDPTMSGINLQPIVIGGTAIVVEENAVYGLRRFDGHQLWKRVFPRFSGDPDPFSSGLVYGLWQWRGNVIVLVGQVSSHSRLLSLNSVTGAVNWELPLGKQGETGNQTLTGDGGLAMIYGYATLTVIDLTTGRIRWGRTAGNSDGPVAVGGVVIAPGKPGSIVGFSSRTGKLLWTRTGMPQQPQLAVSAGHVIVDNPDQAVYPPQPLFPVTALSPLTGRTIWRAATAAAVYMMSAGPSGIVVSTFSPDRLYLIDGRTGHERWSIRYQGSQQLPLDTGTDLIYESGPTGATLVDRRAVNGSVRWTMRVPATNGGPLLRFGPYAAAIANSTAPDAPGEVTAYRLATGKPAWTTKVPTFVQVPPAASGADLLVQPTDTAVGCPVAGAASAVGSVG